MIYLDNAATTYPKPKSVIESVYNSMRYYGANPGRSGYKMALETAEKIYESREAARSFFNVERAENIIFTHNCTAALNICIKSLAKKGKNIVCSSLEHNAVMRPLERLKRDCNIEYRIAEISPNNDEVTVKNIDRLIDGETAAVVITAASNVTGYISPLKKISNVCKKKNVPFAVDAAQGAGIIPLDCNELGIDYLCVAAHKGLYSALGTGILIVNSTEIPDSLIEGGTGSSSLSFLQPDFLPDKLESGTMNTSGIISVKSGIDFVRSVGIGSIYSHEYSLMKILESELKNMKNVTVHSSFTENKPLVPVLSFNIRGYHSEEVSELLAEKGVCVRAGYHCSPLAHKSLGTTEHGTVRISPSIFTKKNNIYFTINCINKLQN